MHRLFYKPLMHTVNIFQAQLGLCTVKKKIYVIKITSTVVKTIQIRNNCTVT